MSEEHPIVNGKVDATPETVETVQAVSGAELLNPSVLGGAPRTAPVEPPAAPEPQTEEMATSEQEETFEKAAEALGLQDEALYDLGDGKTVTGKEARARLRAEDEIRARFGKVGQKEQELAQTQAKLQQDLQIASEFLNSLESDDPMDAINKALATKGVNQVEWWNKFFEKTGEVYKEQTEMSDEERRLARLEQENQMLKQKSEQTVTAQQAQAQQQQMLEKVKAEAEFRGLTFEQIQQNYAEMLNEVQQGKRQDFRGDYQQELAETLEYSVDKRIKNLANEIDPSLAENTDLVSYLRSEVMNPFRKYDISDDKLRETLSDAYKQASSPAEAKTEPVASPKEAAPEEVKVLEDRGEVSDVPKQSAPDNFAPISAKDLMRVI